MLRLELNPAKVVLVNQRVPQSVPPGSFGRCVALDWLEVLAV